MRHHTTQSQLWPGGLSTDNSPQHSTAHEPNEVFSVELSGDDTNDSLPARNRLRPGNVIYEQAFRVYKSALVPTKCLSCDCSCKGIRKMDKVVPAQPEEDYNTYHANVQVLVKQEIFQQLGRPKHSMSAPRTWRGWGSHMRTYTEGETESTSQLAMVSFDKPVRKRFLAPMRRTPAMGSGPGCKSWGKLCTSLSSDGDRHWSLSVAALTPVPENEGPPLFDISGEPSGLRPSAVRASLEIDMVYWQVVLNPSLGFRWCIADEEPPGTFGVCCWLRPRGLAVPTWWISFVPLGVP
ncbi:hypothetical protein HPB51_018844 [Rhipicephalus microplus]|uniref:Uncharacterized protein n=1 Tax=Rhipicephalus microplus TaxID=6941 RepID=A0A9J6DNZ0_RHIMP|nr:hypothetical protein HPB51_018844 [Rhipicephalus microplus]